MVPLRYVLAREFFRFLAIKPIFSANPIRTLLTNLIQQTQRALRSLFYRFEEIQHLKQAQLVFTLGIVFILIILKDPNSNQPGIIGSVVRHYTEETSASIIPTDTTLQFADINSLLGANIESTGQGGAEEDIPVPYTFRDDFIQAVDAVSNDYLDDYKPNKVIEYTVQPGDALSFIASDFGVSINSILWANQLSSPDSIRPDQILRIPPVSGVIHTIQKGDTISTIAKKYNADAARIIAFNDLLEDDILDLGTDLIIPDGTVSIGTAKPSSVSGTANITRPFAYLPDLGDYFKIPAIGFDWGIIHGRNGVDIANSCGTPIYAAADGTTATVMNSGWNGGFGKYIKLVHANGTETLYSHLSKLLITIGENVIKGQEIGLMGTTGRSTGCHLHFEVHGARNPLAKR